MFRGSLVAIVTPMQESGELDLAAYRRLVDWHVTQGTQGIVSMGTTGESATVDPEDHVEVIEAAVQAAAGRVPVIAGAGANSTSEAIELTRHARRVGAVATLQVAPYYNRPTQEGMYRHFRAIAEAVDLPVILYNVPSRTASDVQVDTVVRLAQVPGIAGIKEATGDLNRVTELRRRAPAGFCLLSGNDDSALAFMLMGGHGVISVTANIAPAPMRAMCDAALAADVARARALHEKLFPLHLALFTEPNPIPAKWALARLGKIPAGIRLPLVPLSPPAQERVAAAMRESGID